MNLPLKGLAVLNTRPLGQGEVLNEAIENAGGIAIHCPALALSDVNTNWTSCLPSLSNIEKAIFISANAVEFALKALKKKDIVWPAKIEVIAAGKKTASLLERYQIPVADFPDPCDSEHLLLSPFLQNIAKQNILLFKGEGGRELIAETLLRRGAQLRIFEVYKRIMPSYDALALHSLWQKDAVDIILFTSEEGMYNLFKMFDKKAHPWLCSKPCVVLSKRLALTAAKLGMRTTIISAPEDIFKTLCDYNQG